MSDLTWDYILHDDLYPHLSESFENGEFDMNQSELRGLQDEANFAYGNVPQSEGAAWAQVICFAEIAIQLTQLNEQLAQKPAPVLAQPEYATRPCGLCGLDVVLNGTHVGTVDGKAYHHECYVAVLEDAGINTY